MSQRMNFFAQLQKQSTSNTASASSPSASLDPPSMPSESAKRPASGSIPSLNLDMIKHHHKNSSSNGQPRKTGVEGSPDANANNNSSSSSPSMPLGITKSPSLSESIINVGSREESQPPTHLPTSRSTTVTDPRASTIETNHSDALKLEKASRSSSLRRQCSVTRRVLGPRLTNMDAIVNNDTTAPRSSSKTATATSKPLSTFAKAPFAQIRGSQNGTSTDILDELGERTPPPQTRQQHSRKTSVSSHDSLSRVRSRANYEMDAELYLGNGQEPEEPAPKRVKGEPIDDDTAHSTYSSPSTNLFNSHISTRQPSNEVIDVDSTDLEIPLESQHSVFRPNLQPQPSSHPQQVLSQGQFSLIESINDDFERYLEQQQQKAESLRKKWLDCSMEEWEQGGSDICNKFGAIVERVRDGMQSKIRAFSAVNSRIADHSKALDERKRSLQQEKELLVKETGKVVETKSN